MSLSRLLLPALLALIICYNGTWLRAIYSIIPESDFKFLGTLRSYEVPCTKLLRNGENECDRLYSVGAKDLAVSGSPQPEVSGLGIGVVLGGTEWLCDTKNGLLPIHRTGYKNRELSAFRDGLTLYQTGSLPMNACTGNLFILLKKDELTPSTNIGWKSGALVRGAPAIVSSYKSVNDFFSSYIRAFISLATILFLIISGTSIQTAPGIFWHRCGIGLLAIHFFSSSSIFDFLFPNRFGFGILLTLAGGTGGCLFLLTGLIEVLNQRELRYPSRTPLHGLTIASATLAILAMTYQLTGGQIYANIQLILGISLLTLGALTAASSHAVFGLLLTSDVLATKGILPGLPTNTGVHFFLLCFIYDSLEWIFLNSRYMHQLNHRTTLGDVDKSLYGVRKRFGIRIMSASMFTREFKFQVRKISGPTLQAPGDENKVSQLAASVMTTRSPLLRIRVGSKRSRLLKGSDSIENRAKGTEFCVFPLVHAQKALGTLNITGYSKSFLADPSQMILFLSLMDRIIPRYAESSYHEDLSPNINEQASILAIESNFSANPNKSRTDLSRTLNALAKILDCKIIVSKYLPQEDRTTTFSCHNYADEDAQFLETHSAQIQDALVTSPTTIALKRRLTVYVDNIQRMLSVYPQFLVQLFTRNGTKSLLVAPISPSTSSPWGVIWIEFPNRLNRPESDLRDLAEFLNASIQRQVISYLENETKQALTTELSSLVPIHVLEKLKSGANPREVENGYLLNIDLSGSTNVAKHYGDTYFNKFIQEISLSLNSELSKFNFSSQLIIWDAFIFTRGEEYGPIKEDQLMEILSSIDRVIQTKSSQLTTDRGVSFRSVLHFGDTTRDWNVGSTRTWTISGSALAESCKLESLIKDKKRVMFVSESCPMLAKQGNNTESTRIIKMAA